LATSPRVKVSNAPKRWTETARLCGLAVPTWLAEVGDAAAAEAHRLRVQVEDFSALSPREEWIKVSKNRSREKLSRSAVRRVMHLKNELNVNELARRFGVGSSTIIRILKTYDAAEHHPSLTGPHGANAATRRAFGKRVE
jgi:hypothetical protein